MTEFLEPTEAELDVMLATAQKAANDDERLTQNYLFAALFDRERGFWAETKKGAVWSRNPDGSLRRQKRSMRRREWIEHYFRIKPKARPIQTINANASQRRLECEVRRMERANVPVRIIILKPRQTGFCFAPETRVLTADLRWKRIDAVACGEELVACDEHRDSRGRGGPMRKMRTATVQVVRRLRAPAFRLTLDTGVVLVATGGHRHLCRKRGGTNTEWREVFDTRVGDHIRYVTRPWGETTLRDAWFGGMLDGEGSMRIKKPAGVEVSVCQALGPVCDALGSYLSDAGYSFKQYDDDRKPSATSKLGSKTIRKFEVGRMDEAFRLIGQCRPVRFIGRRWWEGRALPGMRSGAAWAQVVKIEWLPEQEMIDLQTSTKTFIAEGVVSHNSTYCEAMGTEMTLRNKKSRGLIIADNDERAELILGIVDTARSEIHKGGEDDVWKLRMKSKASYSLVWDEPLFSSINITSAQIKAAGRGGTRDWMHITETAFWPEAADRASGVLESLPDMPGTYGLNESTANGDTGWYRDEFWAAWNDRKKPYLDRKTLWSAIFIGWWEHDEYRWSRTYGGGRLLPKELEDRIRASLDEEEQWLLAQRWFRRWSKDDPWEEVEDKATGRKRWRRVGVGWRRVDFDQLAWRRRKIEEYRTKGGAHLFNQEHPSRPEVAFLASGRRVFDPERIEKLLKLTADPVFVGELVMPARDGDPIFGPDAFEPMGLEEMGG